jgi:hypothetical protein
MEIHNSPGACILLKNLVHSIERDKLESFFDRLRDNEFFCFTVVGEEDYVSSKDREQSQHSALEAGMLLALSASQKRCQIFFFNHHDKSTDENFCCYGVSVDDMAFIRLFRKIIREFANRV